MKKLLPIYISFCCLFATFAIYTVYNISWSSVFCDARAFFFLGIGKFGWILTVVITLLVAGFFICALVFLKISFCWDVRIFKWNIQFDSYRLIERYSKRLTFLQLCFSLILILFFHAEDFKMHSSSDWEYPLTIAHGGGEIDGYTYSNSLEAILTNYEKGHRTFEIDFSVTRDQVLVAKHDWDMVVQEGMESGYVPTKEEFKSTPIYGAYTPLTFEELCQLMEEYPDIWIVTDVKDANAKEMKEAIDLLVQTTKELNREKLLDRLIVQVYNEETFFEVKEIYDFERWIFTLYQCWDGNEESFPDYARFCHVEGIEILTIWDVFATPRVLEIAKNYGVDIYVHTVNDSVAAQEYVDMGVAGIYTDSVAPGELRRKE